MENFQRHFFSEHFLCSLFTEIWTYSLSMIIFLLKYCCGFTHYLLFVQKSAFPLYYTFEKRQFWPRKVIQSYLFITTRLGPIKWSFLTCGRCSDETLCQTYLRLNMIIVVVVGRAYLFADGYQFELICMTFCYFKILCKNFEER